MNPSAQLGVAVRSNLGLLGVGVLQPTIRICDGDLAVEEALHQLVVSANRWVAEFACGGGRSGTRLTGRRHESLKLRYESA